MYPPCYNPEESQVREGCLKESLLLLTAASGSIPPQRLPRHRKRDHVCSDVPQSERAFDPMICFPTAYQKSDVEADRAHASISSSI